MAHFSLSGVSSGQVIAASPVQSNHVWGDLQRLSGGSDGK
jgi:hypothetical protein